MAVGARKTRNILWSVAVVNSQGVGRNCGVGSCFLQVLERFGRSIKFRVEGSPLYFPRLDDTQELLAILQQSMGCPVLLTLDVYTPGGKYVRYRYNADHIVVCDTEDHSRQLGDSRCTDQ